MSNSAFEMSNTSLFKFQLTTSQQNLLAKKGYSLFLVIFNFLLVFSLIACEFHELRHLVLNPIQHDL